MSRREVVLHETLSWLGTPYHHLACVKGVGVDCAMLLVAVFRDSGLVPQDLDPRPYAPDWHLHRNEEKFLGWLQQYAEQVERPGPGDVVVWRYGRTYSHGAIVVGEAGEIVHAYKNAGCVVRGHLHETELAQRQQLAWRVRGIEEVRDGR
jgi:NlpC/P60 family putative phage cell wall peptidase